MGSSRSKSSNFLDINTTWTRKKDKKKPYNSSKNLVLVTWNLFTWVSRISILVCTDQHVLLLWWIHSQGDDFLNGTQMNNMTLKCLSILLSEHNVLSKDEKVGLFIASLDVFRLQNLFSRYWHFSSISQHIWGSWWHCGPCQWWSGACGVCRPSRSCPPPLSSPPHRRGNHSVD